MSRGFSKDFYLEVAKGNVAGHSAINKFGHNPSIATNTDPEDVWSGGDLYAFYPATAQAMEVLSDDDEDGGAGGDTGALTIQVYGLDTNWLEIEETVILNGTTIVNLANTYIRMYRVMVLTAGSAGTNVGNIDVRIYQQYEVYVLEEAIMYCWVISNYAVDRDIAIEVWISNATHNILIYDEIRVIAPAEVYNFTVLWTFLYVDYWDVKLVVTDIFSDEVYVAYCYWYVYEGYFELSIEQDYYALLDEEVWMRFEVENFYDVDKTIDVELP